MNTCIYFPDAVIFVVGIFGLIWQYGQGVCVDQHSISAAVVTVTLDLREGHYGKGYPS